MDISRGILLSFFSLSLISCGVNENKIPGSPGYVPPVEANVIPDAPSNLEANVLDSSRINIRWSDNSAEELGFELQRSMTYNGVSSDFATVTTLPANANSYIDSTIQGGRSYTYRVRAYNNSGESGFSNDGTGVVPLNIRAPVGFN